ncbi:MAG: restriction endonuclease subunit S [Erythrobacter sp.]|nr:MAG: restriction endonuclease subunit S [Erythrobacter sp.]
MTEGWEEKPLGDVAKLRQGKFVKAELFADEPSGVKVFSFYGGSSIRGYVDFYDYEHRQPFITCRGSNCGLAFLTEEKASVSNICMAIEAENEILNDFIYYWALSSSFEDVISGSAQPQITAKDLSKKEIAFPDSKDEQKAIAEVLSSLDDKIDLLQRQNATLEALAETLFRQYFIEEAEDDWGEAPLDKVAEYLNGLACQKYPAKNPVERLPVLKIKDLKGGLSESSDWATSKVPAEYIVENGDIIFSWSASLLVKLWDGPTCVLNQHLFKVTSALFPNWFVYQWTKHHMERFIAIAETKATTMGHIKRTDLAEAMVKIPDRATLVKMEPVFAPLHTKIITNNRQIATLKEKLDALLPKLMSGELRVSLELTDA